MNNESLKILTSLHALSGDPVNNKLAILAHIAQMAAIYCPDNSTKEFVRNFQQIMQNKPNFSEDENNATHLSTKNYKKFLSSGGTKTNPIQTQFKPNSKPIARKAKKNAFSRKGNFTFVFTILHAKLITLKGANNDLKIRGAKPIQTQSNPIIIN